MYGVSASQLLRQDVSEEGLEEAQDVLWAEGGGDREGVSGGVGLRDEEAWSMSAPATIPVRRCDAL